METYLSEFERLVKIMERLRRECPWDRKQTPETLRQYILEEAYETIEAIDHQNWTELRKELGDLLLQIVFQTEIAQEHQRFELAEVIAHINNKLVERHPHVFGDVTVRDARDVAINWEQIKQRTENRKSVLEGVPKHLSALLRAQRLQDKAAGVGFDWDNTREVLDKIREEIDEVENTDTPEALEDELGDLLFALVNYCRFRGISAEDALRKTSGKFISRFQYIESELEKADIKPADATLEQMEALWQAAKKLP